MTYTAHCLRCDEDYMTGVQSGHCPHRPMTDPREVERYAKLQRKSDARTAARNKDRAANARKRKGAA